MQLASVQLKQQLNDPKRNRPWTMNTFTIPHHFIAISADGWNSSFNY
jgi:hypothetical protein